MKKYKKQLIEIKETISKKDDALFKELDKHSKPLRGAAVNLADFLLTLSNKTNEIIELIGALQEIKNIPIEEIDIGINKVKNMFLKLTMNIDEKSPFIKSLTEEKLTILFKKEEDFSKEAVLLVQKTFEINSV